MNFKKLNNLTGWLVCIVACTVYVLTAEATGSFWDCGEFVSSCYKLQIPHPPGAPLFVLIGRFFIILFGNDPLTAAKAVNVMSALASGFTILFLFWTITHFARKIVKVDVNGTMTPAQTIQILGSGVVGALAYTFSDSFWYSAVEGEVYALSSFFSAIVFWAVLKWENVADEPDSDKWLVFIAFLVGLSIGVHLLCLLNIPAVVMVYYYKRQKQINYALIKKRFIMFVSVVGVLGMILGYLALKKEGDKLSGYESQLQQMFGEDIQIHDSTLSGLVLFGSLVAIGLVFLLEKLYPKKKELVGGSYIFFVFGCILTGIIQVAVIQYSIAGAGVFDRIGVNNFHLPFFAGFGIFFLFLAVVLWWLLTYAKKRNWEYLRLAVWCITFMLIGYSTYLTTMIRSNADPAIDMYNVDNPISLVGYLGRDQYGDFPLLYGQKFNASPVQVLEGAEKYQKSKNSYIGIGKDLKYVYLPKDKMVFPRMWDASNEQGHADYYALYAGIEKYRDKNGRETWEEGRPNQGDNVAFFGGYQFYWMYLRYFLWNFVGKQNDIQGVYIGNVRDGNWKSGISLIDNIFFGDQSAMPDSMKHNKANNTLFALPFILGMIGLFYHFKAQKSDGIANFLFFFFTGIAIILYLNQAGNQPRERDYAFVGSFYAFAVWIGLGVLQIIAWLQKKINQTTAAALATVVCFLAVPVIMAQQEWDDHDRSQKTLARDLARNYLESCAPNAILFCFGDNDTYPLWYAQEVEGIRRDVRVINYSLLGIDWYINQLRYKVNKSDAIDVLWSAEQIEGRKRDYVVFGARADMPEDKYYDLKSILTDYVGSDEQSKMYDRGGGDFTNAYPTHKVKVPVNKAAFANDSTLNSADSLVNEIAFDIPKNSLFKNDLAVLCVIAANNWKRPIYFSSPFGELGFGKYLRKDGLCYRLVPMENNQMNVDWSYKVMMNTFASGNCDKPGVYYDEENRRHLNALRGTYAEFASFMADRGRKDEAKKLLEKADKLMLQENFPYGMVSRGNMHSRASMIFLEACYKAGADELAKKVYASIEKDFNQQKAYYNSLPELKKQNMQNELKDAENYLNALKQIKDMYSGKSSALSKPTVAEPNNTQPVIDTMK